MNNFIKKLEQSTDLDVIKNYVQEILNFRPWPAGNKLDEFVQNQIGLNHRENCSNLWLDAAGGYNDNQVNKKESDFNVWNDKIPTNFVNLIKSVTKENKVNYGRVRIMRLMPKTGLSYHFDTEKRIHLAITTNPGCFIFSKSDEGSEFQTQGYHIPADGNFYMVDTTMPHFVYNAGRTERVHLVINCLSS